MNANQTPVIWTVVIAAVILLILGGIGVASMNNNLKLVADGVNDVNVPTASELASLIVIPEVVIPEYPEVVIPEYEEVDMSKVNNVWNSIFGLIDVENDFKDLVEDALVAEFDEDKALDEMPSEFYELEEDFELVDVKFINENNLNKFNFGNYALDKYTFCDDNHKRIATIELTYEFKYSTTGNSPLYTYDGVLTVTGTYDQVYDWDDEVYEDAEFEITDYSI